MIWNYEKACKEAGMEVEKVKELRRFFDMEKKKLKRENKVLEEKHVEYSLLSELEENGFRKAGLVEDRTVNVEEEAIRSFEISLLGNCFSILTAEERQLIVWHYYDEMSFRVIAKRFGITLSAVQNRHEKILKKLRREMGVETDE